MQVPIEAGPRWAAAVARRSSGSRWLSSAALLLTPAKAPDLDLTLLIKAALMGVVEGLTEFLPI